MGSVVLWIVNAWALCLYKDVRIEIGGMHVLPLKSLHLHRTRSTWMQKSIKSKITSSKDVNGKGKNQISLASHYKCLLLLPGRMGHYMSWTIGHSVHHAAPNGVHHHHISKCTNSSSWEHDVCPMTIRCSIYRQKDMPYSIVSKTVEISILLDCLMPLEPREGYPE